ncbi:MAG: GNVR domain-containing protein [Burkholderiaceae bacterium]
MNLAHFLAVARARWRLALAVFVVTVAAAVVAALLVPRTYTATAALLIDVSRPDPVTGLSNGGNPSPTILATQVGVLKSERVAREVVRRLDLASDAKLRATWMASTQGRGDFTGWLAQALQKKTEILPERDANVVAIDAQAGTPEQAARIADTFAQVYLDVSAALRAEAAQQASAFFERRSTELRANLERAQARLADYQRTNGVVVSDAQVDSETTRLNELSLQLAVAQAAAAETGSRSAFAGQGGADQLPEAQSSLVVSGLRADLVRAETQLQELSSRLDVNHPQVVQARNAVALLRSRLDAETRRIGSAVTLASAAQRQREAELRGAMEAQRQRVLRLKTLQGDGHVLLRDVENAQRAYDGVEARLSQAALESHVMQGTATLLAPAMVPAAPSSPGRTTTVALAGVLGLVLAIAAVLLLEVADPRLRTEAAAAQALGVQVLGAVPRPDTAGSFRSRKVPLVGRPGVRRLAAPSQEP